MKFLALFPAKFSDLIDRTLKITQNTRRRGRSLRQCAQFRVFCSAACKTCACCGQMCGLGGRFFCPAARRAGFLQEAEEKAAEKGSPPRGAGSAQPRLRGCCRFAIKPKPQIQFAVWKGRNEHRGKETSLAAARSVVVVSDAPPTAPSFPSCRKRRGRKGALGRVWCILPLILGGKQCFRRRSTR